MIQRGSVVAFSVVHTKEPHHAYISTLKVAGEEEPGDVDRGIQSYNDVLAEIGYAPGHHDNDETGGDTAY